MMTQFCMAGLLAAAMIECACQKPYETTPVPGKLAPVAGSSPSGEARFPAPHPSPPEGAVK